MKLFLGVDGGQSDTTALIGDEQGHVLGLGMGGPCNHVAAEQGREKLTRAVSDSLAAACKQAGLEMPALRFAAACCGMSGGPADKEAILRELLPADRLVVTDDAVIALAGATAGGPGIITIAGTGSIAFGRNAAGRTQRAGGWGYVFGDEGGGFDMIRQAVRAALRYEEGWGTPTTLYGALLTATACDSANEVMHRFYSRDWPRSRVAALAPVVDEAAQAGDEVAVAILQNAAQQLAVLTAAVRRPLWHSGEPVRVVWSGGIFRIAMVCERYRQLVELDEGNQAGPPAYGPAAGALLEAYRAAGIEPRISGDAATRNAGSSPDPAA